MSEHKYIYIMIELRFHGMELNDLGCFTIILQFLSSPELWQMTKIYNKTNIFPP